jgi:hypothetical protein
MTAKQGEKPAQRFIDAGRAETEIFVPDPDIASVYDADRNGHGASSGSLHMQQLIERQVGLDHDLSAGDPDAVVEDANFVGEEAVGGGNPTPDQGIVAELGHAIGLEYQDAEPLHTTEKLQQRDRKRWELDPASSEDYQDRVGRRRD